MLTGLVNLLETLTVYFLLGLPFKTPTLPLLIVVLVVDLVIPETPAVKVSALLKAASIYIYWFLGMIYDPFAIV